MFGWKGKCYRYNHCWQASSSSFTHPLWPYNDSSQEVRSTVVSVTILNSPSCQTFPEVLRLSYIRSVSNLPVYQQTTTQSTDVSTVCETYKVPVAISTLPADAHLLSYLMILTGLRPTKGFLTSPLRSVVVRERPHLASSKPAHHSLMLNSLKTLRLE